VLKQTTRVLGADLFLLRAVASKRFREEIREAAMDAAESRHALVAILARMQRERSGADPSVRLVHVRRKDAGIADESTC
jgi:hypothetical protein